jgi:hypothetical protein
MLFVAVRVWFGLDVIDFRWLNDCWSWCFWIEKGFVGVVLQLLPVWQVMLIQRSTRVRQAPVSFKAQARQTTHDRYNHDDSFRTTRDALVNTKVRKYFPGYGIFTGVITSYYPITDTYHLLLDDGDEETDSSENIQKYIVTSRALPSMTKNTRKL